MTTNQTDGRGGRPTDRAFSRIGPLHEASVAYRDAVRAADRACHAIGRLMEVDAPKDLTEGSMWWLAENDIAVRESLRRLAEAVTDLRGLADKQGAAAVAETSSLMALSKWVAKAHEQATSPQTDGSEPKPEFQS